MRGPAHAGVLADTVDEQLLPQVVIISPTKYEQIRIGRYRGKQIEEGPLRYAFAPVQRGTAGQPQRIRILPRELPDEAERRRAQPVKIVGQRLDLQIARAHARKHLVPHGIFSFT